MNSFLVIKSLIYELCCDVLCRFASSRVALRCAAPRCVAVLWCGVLTFTVGAFVSACQLAAHDQSTLTQVTLHVDHYVCVSADVVAEGVSWC